MKPTRLKTRLTEGRPSVGAFISMCSPIATEAMALAGFDWLLIDMEHGPGDYQTLLSQLQGINASGDCTPIVRVQWNDTVVIKRVLDLGAEGVMVPGIRSVDEARAAIAATKYPPDGVRGIATARGARYGHDKAYLKDANQHIAVVLQVETRDAVDNVEAILDLPGIDVCFLGPNDLSADMGHTGNPGHEEVHQAIAKVETAANARNIPLGTISRNWDQAKGLFDKGYKAVTVGSDMHYLVGVANDVVKHFRDYGG